MGLTLHAFNQTKVIKLGYDNYPGKYRRLETVLLHLNQRPDIAGYDSIDMNNLNRITINSVTKESTDKKQDSTTMCVT